MEDNGARLLSIEMSFLRTIGEKPEWTTVEMKSSEKLSCGNYGPGKTSKTIQISPSRKRQADETDKRDQTFQQEEKWKTNKTLK